LRELYIEENTPVHQLHPGLKLIIFVVYLIFLNLTVPGDWLVLILFFLILWFLIIWAKIPVSLLAKRSLFALPFVLAAAPLVFQGLPFWRISIPLMNIRIGINMEGTIKFFSILIKAVLSVQAAILITATTRFPDLIYGMKSLKIPTIFLTIFSLTWRFLFVLVGETQRMIHARDSRSSTLMLKPEKTGGKIFWRAKVVGGMAGSLFIRAFERSDRIYQAMISRGYDGNSHPSIMTPFTSGKRDLMILVCFLSLIIMTWVFGVYRG